MRDIMGGSGHDNGEYHVNGSWQQSQTRDITLQDLMIDEMDKGSASGDSSIERGTNTASLTFNHVDSN